MLNFDGSVKKNTKKKKTAPLLSTEKNRTRWTTSDRHPLAPSGVEAPRGAPPKALDRSSAFPTGRVFAYRLVDFLLHSKRWLRGWLGRDGQPNGLLADLGDCGAARRKVTISHRAVE